jgi:hypothetical protein
MPRVKIIVAASVAVLALTAAVSASAAQWYVGGAGLTGSASIAGSSELDALEIIEEPAEGFRAHCRGPILWFNAIITPPDKILALRVVHDNCLILTPANCTLVGGIIELGHTQGLLLPPVGGNPPVSHLRPGTGKTLGVLEIAGTSCAIAGEKPITGEYTEALGTGQTEEVKHQLTGLGSLENNSLLIGGHPAYISGGNALLALSSGSKWSFH